MYQNTTFIPLLSATGEVTHLCLIIYDVTDNAVHKRDLEKANDELALLSQTDGLTNLYNRMHWENCLEAEYKRWTRSHHTSCLVMLDIDHFKQVNDNYGHLVGDEVIKSLSTIIKRHIRETDVSGRYGGEEFAVLLADTSIENAQVFAERLRFEVEQSLVTYNDIEIKYTISIGLAEVDTTVKNYETWIEYADAALYQSKASGRNKVSIHTKTA